MEQVTPYVDETNGEGQRHGTGVFHDGQWKNDKPFNLPTKEEEAFVEAARLGDIDLLRKFLENNLCHVDCQNNNGDTALIWAANKGHRGIVDFLIANKCNLNVRNKNGFTAFLSACHNKRIEIATCFLELGVDVNSQTDNGISALHIACNEIIGGAELVRLLCKYDCKITHDAFFTSCNSGYTEIINLLLKAGFDPLSDGRQGGSYIALACMRGHLQIVEALIAHNCDINATNVGCDGESCLVMACRGNYVEIVKLLLAHNCDVNFRNESGMLGFTALLHACLNGNVEIVKLLVDKDCLYDARSNNGGNTTLILAVTSRNIEIIDILIKKGCDINATSYDGSTALMKACEHTSHSKPGVVDVVKTLLASNCDVNLQDNKGFTALMIACRNCGISFYNDRNNQKSFEYMEIVKLLLVAGSDYKRVMIGGKTALDMTYYADFGKTERVMIGGVTAVDMVNNKDFGKTALDMINNADLRKEVQQFIDFPLELKQCYMRLPRLFSTTYHKKHTLRKTIGKGNWIANCDICKQSGSVYCCDECNFDVCVVCINKEESSKSSCSNSESFASEVIEENKEDIADIKDLLTQIGFSKRMSNKYAEILVIKCQIGSEILFRRKLSSNLTHYISILNFNDFEVELLRDYFSSNQNDILSLQNATNGGSQTPTSGGYASSIQTTPRSPSSPHNNTIDWSELDYVEVIGNGAYSVVLKAKYRSIIVAVKILTVNATLEALYELANDELISIYNAEMKVLRRDTIIQAIGICQGALPPILLTKFNINIAHGCGIVLRYEAGGSLESLLYPPSSKPKKLIPLQEKIRILMHIASGLDELHSAGILHGDIKPGNVLLSEHNPPLVRLADFGHAEIKEKSIDKDSELRETVHRKGTPIYTAPECLPSLQSSTVSKITRRTDIYSFAIMAWEVLNKNGQRAFANITNEHTLIHNVTVNDSRPELNELTDDVPPAVRNMIELCWEKDRAKRLTALQCHNTLELAYNIISQAKFDIFFSHPWKNKNVLRHVKKFLNSHGYRVWYDENDIGWDLAKSMQEGIENSQVVLVCLNKAYEASRNCMFELIESSKTNKKIVTLVTEPDPFGWAGSNATHGNVRDLCQLSTKMFIDIGELCVKPGWPAENDPLDTPVPDALLYELREKVAELIRLLQGGSLTCMPSL